MWKKEILAALLFISLGLGSFAQQKVIVKPANIKYDTSHVQGDYINGKPDVTLLVSPAAAEQKDTTKGIHLRPDQLVWKDVMPPMPAGAQVATLEGSPKQEGIFTIRFKLPSHWLLPSHSHPGDERVTVLSGSVYVGFGDKLDTTKATKYTAGSFYINPAKSHHYIFTSDEGSIIQVTAMGPWGVTYLEEKK